MKFLFRSRRLAFAFAKSCIYNCKSFKFVTEQIYDLESEKMIVVYYVILDNSLS